MTTPAAFNRDLLEFIDHSPTPFHATFELAARLAQAGFQRLDEGAVWPMRPAGRYFLTRNDSSIIAFVAGTQSPADTGLRMVGAHTDSPCLKLRPQALSRAHGYLQLGVEVYGGALLNPWFDRDLSIAGRVTLRGRDGAMVNRLVDFQRPVAIIPSLAIHLDREVNRNRQINAQTQLAPILSLGDSDTEFPALLAAQLQVAPDDILAFDLSLYDVQTAAIVGLNDEFIAGARLDNLLSCYCGLTALLNADGAHSRLLVCNDHEEVGSGSTAGARGTFLRSVLERLIGAGEPLARAMAQSWLVSTDNAHGIHPNFADRHDAQHGPLLNGGPAIKVNHGQSYATSSESAGMFRAVCQAAGIPVQAFVSRNDLSCGSTIGPLTATVLGVRTVDVGIPTFAMHSIRELAGSRDPELLCRALQAFYDMPATSVMAPADTGTAG